MNIDPLTPIFIENEYVGNELLLLCKYLIKQFMIERGYKLR